MTLGERCSRIRYTRYTRYSPLREILKILKENDVKINENKSGIYINLSFLSNEAIDKIEKYIKYVDEQEATLSIIERQKDELTMNL